MRRLLMALLLGMMIFGTVPVLAAGEEGSCAETSAKVDELSSKVSNDMRRIQRELSALKAQIEKPGLNEAFAGVGYIIGLFGVAFFVAGRRRKE
jgi:nickel transport protein